MIEGVTEAVCGSEQIAVIKDVVLTVGALVGIYVAIHGLKTWSRQLKGGVEYNLARQLLRNTYRLRESFKVVRNPAISADEQAEPTEEKREQMSLEQQRYFGLSRAYQSRWDKVVEVRADLQVDLLEAEVLWGKGISESFKPLFYLESELFRCVRLYLGACNPS
ncbi:MAG TPA: hypothetical protein VN028_01455, partial [Rhodocyclaceae bacterium]|nr:hypothetical protein [Rhodocyclaceae bacterium]